MPSRLVTATVAKACLVLFPDCSVCFRFLQTVSFSQQEGGASDSLTKALIADDSQQVQRGRLG